MALARKLQMYYIYNDETESITFDRVNPNASYTVLNEAMKQMKNLMAVTYLHTRVIDTQYLDELAEKEGQ